MKDLSEIIEVFNGIKSNLNKIPHEEQIGLLSEVEDLRDWIDENIKPFGLDDSKISILNCHNVGTQISYKQQIPINE